MGHASAMAGTRHHRHHKVPTDLRISEAGGGTRTQHPIADEGGELRRKAFESIGAGLMSGLPREDDALWDAIALMPGSEVDQLIAFAVGASVSLGREHSGLTAKLLSALGFDMADHFRPTAANYFGRVPKAMIVAALDEAGKVDGDAQRSSLMLLKKGDLAARAEAELADTRWVPASIRTPPLRALAGVKGTGSKRTRRPSPRNRKAA